jgi:hypothetical protein
MRSSSKEESSSPRPERFLAGEGTVASLCGQCKHKIAGKACGAFDAIPFRYLAGMEEHRELDGTEDHELVFEPIESD